MDNKDKRELYLNALQRGVEFTKKGGKSLKLTNKEIKDASCNDIFKKLKDKKKEIEELILEFDYILTDVKKCK